jgi:hypothetical protein
MDRNAIPAKLAIQYTLLKSTFSLSIFLHIYFDRFTALPAKMNFYVNGFVHEVYCLLRSGMYH